jgi:hypothetical protein
MNYSTTNKFTWKNKDNKENIKFILSLLIVTAVVFGIQCLSYFGIAIWFGRLWGEDNTLNLQFRIDRIMPWCTQLYPFYMVWPFIWFVVIPVFIYFSSGKQAYYQYVVNSLLMYAVGSIIYALMPTTCTPWQFINGPYAQLPTNAPFYNEIIKLANNPSNIWGAAPSYHNYWASLFIFFAFKKDVKFYFRYPMVIIGALISISTFMLHQHNVADAVITYSMTFAFICIINLYKLDYKFELCINKIFRINA